MGRDSLRTRWVRTEPTVQIVGEQYRKDQRNHNKLKREAVKFESDFIEARKNWVFVPPSNMNLLMRFPEGDLILSVPHAIGSMLLHKRRAHILESDVRPDAVITSESFEEAYDFFFGADNAPTLEVTAW